MYMHSRAPVGAATARGCSRSRIALHCDRGSILRALLLRRAMNNDTVLLFCSFYSSSFRIVSNHKRASSFFSFFLIVVSLGEATPRRAVDAMHENVSPCSLYYTNLVSRVLATSKYAGYLSAIVRPSSRIFFAFDFCPISRLVKLRNWRVIVPPRFSLHAILRLRFWNNRDRSRRENALPLTE